MDFSLQVELVTWQAKIPLLVLMVPNILWGPNAHRGQRWSLYIGQLWALKTISRVAMSLKNNQQGSYEP